MTWNRSPVPYRTPVFIKFVFLLSEVIYVDNTYKEFTVLVVLKQSLVQYFLIKVLCDNSSNGPFYVVTPGLTEGIKLYCDE